MTFTIFKLTFLAPLHLSRGKLNSYESSDTTLHSDTIKAALFVTAKQLFGLEHAEAMHERVRISSAFPFDKEGCWLPRPLGYSFAEETANNRKEFKGIQFFTLQQFNDVIKKKKPTILYDEEMKVVEPKIWKRDTTQRVKINDDKDNDPFYLEKLYPKSADAGLYFIALSDDKNGTYTEESLFEDKVFESALKLLGDNGIGLQRGLGNGHFSYQKDTITIDLPQEAANWMALSLYCPKDENEIKDVIHQSNYQFMKRGGWLNSAEEEEHLTIRKQAVMMFTEGSVFAFPSQQAAFIIKGEIKEVAPKEPLPPDIPKLNHKVFRDGKAIFLPINI
jgi:CRISPR-associated protein Csm4